MIEHPDVVIDSNMALLSAIKNPLAAQAQQVLHRLESRRAVIYAPRLWSYEVTSALHKYLFDKIITQDAAYKILSALFEIPIHFMDGDAVLCRTAFDWATRLGQKASYDGFYLATAEKLGAEFWTADQRLYNRARQLGAAWVHWIGEKS